MTKNDMEILAPAGCIDTLVCAINNGADAVYIGGQAFSARKNAVNFTEEEIIAAVRYAHLHDSKIYVTVNTLVGDSDLKELYSFVDFLYKAGVDALIIQDIGVASMIKKYFPDFEIHASTQMTIHNIKGAEQAAKMGFSRVVLSRELTLKEIKNISDNVDIELEVFVHGALCMCYSGQCLMSSFIGGRSGNKGACAQPCRLPYTLLDKNKIRISDKNKYLLSLKDLCLIDDMDELALCNVKSLKIEGRMKSSEYVSLVTSMYDKYRAGGKVSTKDKKYLENIFSRSGFTKSYLTGETGRHMLNYDDNNDKVYDNISDEVHLFAKKLTEKKPDTIPLDCKVNIKYNSPMQMELSARGKTVVVSGNVLADKAIRVPLTEQRVKEQISKLGDTFFALRNISTDIDEEISLPIKEINEVRRKGVSLLERELICIPQRHVQGEFSFNHAECKESRVITCAEIKNINQFICTVNQGFDKILIPYDIYSSNKSHIDSFNAEIAVVLPPVCRDIRQIDYSILPGEIYLTNLSQLFLCSDYISNADFRLNVCNSYSMEFLKNCGINRVCLSPELTVKAANSIEPHVPAEVIVYGRIPVMTVQNCVVRSAADKCVCGDEYYFLKDRKDACFPVFTDKSACVNVIYNSKPHYMADRMNEITSSNIKAYRFIFTTETNEEIINIAEKFRNREKADFDFTRGHYYRGV